MARLLRFVRRVWEWFTQGYTVWELIQKIAGSKAVMVPLLTAFGTLAAWAQQAGPLGMFFGIFGGLGLGLFIANEVSARRIVRRFKDIEPSPEGEDEPLNLERVISAFIILADQLFIEGLTQVTDETHEEWGQRILKWTALVSEFLRDKFSEKEVVLFSDTVGLRPETFNEKFSDVHNSDLAILDKLRGNLRKVLHQL